MDCKLAILVKTDGPRSKWACTDCGRETSLTAKPPEKLHQTCKPNARERKAGGNPGTLLEKLIEQLGFKTGDVLDPGCRGTCQQYINWMNSIGWQRCQKRRDVIVKHLNAQKKMLTWKATLKTAVLAVQQQWFNPLDPAGSLVDEAIRRASASASSPSKSPTQSPQ